MKLGTPVGRIPTFHSREALLHKHPNTARELCLSAIATMTEAVPENLKRLLPFVVRCFTHLGGYVNDDLVARWASKIPDITPGQLLTANMAYECAQAYDSRIFGCTATAFPTKRFGMVHARTLDWPLPGMGKSTAIVKTSKYVSVTNPGMLGALSGMVPGEFSISLNWAPPAHRPKAEMSPLFLVQDVLERARTYREAKKMLCETIISTAALFTLVGRKTACKVERTSAEYCVIDRDRGSLVTTNHFECEDFEQYNADQDILDFSTERYNVTAQAALEFKRAKRLGDCADVLRNESVLHEHTIQRMVFSPSTGKHWVRAYDNDNLL